MLFDVVPPPCVPAMYVLVGVVPPLVLPAMYVLIGVGPLRCVARYVCAGWYGATTMFRPL